MSLSNLTPVRTLAVECPRWAITAAGLHPDVPAATFFANRVVESSRAAREWGIVRGLRRRESQARCPELEVLQHDEVRDARAFEPVVMAVESISPHVEIARPGLVVLATRGPARYFGGEEALVSKVCATVDAAMSVGGTPAEPCRAGIADGPFAAELAAAKGTIVPPGQTPEFLAPFPVDALRLPDFADLLVRLGIRTLGDLAALPRADVVSRFGAEGEWAHRVAECGDDRPLAPREAVADLSVRRELDPAVQRVDVAMFAGKALADELVARMTGLGLACAKLRIEVSTEHGEDHVRTWRYSAAFTSAAIAERVRWQLEGWLGLPESQRPTGGIALIALVPEDVGPAVGVQSGFWGRSGDVSDRIRRALARVQGLLGHEGVAQPVLSGGRDLREQVRLVPWGDPVEPRRPGLPGDQTVRGPVTVELPPWPGRIPSPSPSLVPDDPMNAEVVDERGDPVVVTGRLEISAPPARVRVSGWKSVEAWAGPWPVDERWWDRSARRRAARLQVALEDGTACLLVLRGGNWQVEALYD